MSLPESLEGIRDASTVVLLRDGVEALEVLLMQRHSKSGFMGGAYVFPGGKVDDVDCFLPADSKHTYLSALNRLDVTPGTQPGDARKMGFLVAALREVYEEVGLLLGVDPISRNQPESHSNATESRIFKELLIEVDMVKAIGSLNYFAHWVTPSFEKKRFDTRFFVARAPENQQAVGDDREVTDLVWMPVLVALERQSQSEIVLPPPTLKILEDIGRFQKVDEVIECARQSEVQALMPKIVSGLGDASLSVILPWDKNYKNYEGESLDFDANLEPVFGGKLVSRIELFEKRWRTNQAVKQ